MVESEEQSRGKVRRSSVSSDKGVKEEGKEGTNGKSRISKGVSRKLCGEDGTRQDKVKNQNAVKKSAKDAGSAI